jgi:peptidase M28-like protein
VPDVPSLDETIHQILSVAREAGTPETAAARELVAAHLTQLGYSVTVQQFSFAPSSLRAFPIFGLGLGCLSLVLLPFLVSGRFPPWTALAVWAVGLLATQAVAWGVGLGWVSLGESRREDANLIATRGGSSPRRWLVAHLDSKAQGHSMAGRLVAVWISGLAIMGQATLGFFRLSGPIRPLWLGVGTALALLAGFLAGRGRLRGRSLGARDNGTGIVAALSAAEATSDSGIGILITGAEEFGLVGARVFAQLAPNLQETEFVNLDTLDQEGRLYLVSHDPRGEHLADKLKPELAELGLPITSRRLPLGIFVDSAPLARAAPAITIGRLTWRTLRRIHTTTDTPEDLHFDTAKQVGKAIVGSLVPSLGAR